VLGEAPIRHRKIIYTNICSVISDHIDQIAWDHFSLVDWTRLAQMAEREGVAPMLYWKLKNSSVEVPLSTLNFLRSTYYKNLAQSTLLYKELGVILKSFDEAGISVIVLKGAALAATVYEDIGLRPMGDLDLLVKQDQFHSALNVMESIGYVEEPIPHHELNRQIGYDVQLWLDARYDLKVELHWDLVTRGDAWFGPEIEWFWKQAQHWRPTTQEVFGRSFDNALALSLDCSLLYQSAHLLLHHGISQARLLWFFDIHQLVDHCHLEVDWDLLVKRVQGSKWAFALGTVLAQTHNLFATSVPEQIITTLTQGDIIISENMESFQHRASRIHTRATDVWEFFSFLDFGNRVRYVIAMAFPRPQYVRWRYHPRPAWLWPLYYPYRWLRIVREAMIIITKLLFRVRVES
jgi:hypothetical protein